MAMLSPVAAAQQLSAQDLLGQLLQQLTQQSGPQLLGQQVGQAPAPQLQLAGQQPNPQLQLAGQQPSSQQGASQRPNQWPGWEGGEPWGITGLDEALQVIYVALPAEELADITFEDFLNKVNGKFVKVSKAFRREAKTKDKTKHLWTAKSNIADFVGEVLGSLEQLFHDQPWYSKINWSDALLCGVHHTFNDATFMYRALRPNVNQYVYDAIHLYHAERRFSETLWSILTLQIGLSQDKSKKVNRILNYTFDDAFMKAPYGSSAQDTPAMNTLMDFVIGWMLGFVKRAEDFLRAECGNQLDQKVLFVAVLFQHLTSPTYACIPEEILGDIGGASFLPAYPWAFIAQTAEMVFIQVEEEKQAQNALNLASGVPAAKKPRLGF